MSRIRWRGWGRRRVEWKGYVAPFWEMNLSSLSILASVSAPSSKRPTCGRSKYSRKHSECSGEHCIRLRQIRSAVSGGTSSVCATNSTYAFHTRGCCVTGNDRNARSKVRRVRVTWPTVQVHRCKQAKELSTGNYWHTGGKELARKRADAIKGFDQNLSFIRRKNKSRK